MNFHFKLTLVEETKMQIFLYFLNYFYINNILLLYLQNRKNVHIYYSVIIQLQAEMNELHVQR